MDNEERKSFSRREILQAAVGATVPALADAAFSGADAQRGLPPILGPDGRPLQLFNNPNVTFEGRRIQKFYGINREDVEDLPEHSHTNAPDPYEGYNDKTGISCCNKSDCGPAIVNQIGQRPSGEGIYAYGIKINGAVTFAITIPNTKIYTDVTMPGEYPNHGCILGNQPLCLFLRPGL